MSPPDVNLKKQEKRHWGPLVGFALCALFVVGLLVWWLSDELEGDVEQPVEPAAATTESVDPAATTTETVDPGAATTAQ